MCDDRSDPATPDALQKAKIERNVAQAEFFQKRAEQLEKKNTPQAKPWTPAEKMGCVGQVITLISVAGAILVSWNSVAEVRRGREDTAFYEALKRMGDKDSAISRAGAATLLAMQAENPKYYAAARLQLLHAFLLEDDEVVLGAIQGACSRLLKNEEHSEETRTHLAAAEEVLEIQVVASLAWLVADQPVGDKQSLTDGQWSAVDVLALKNELSRQVLDELVKSQAEVFSSDQKAAKAALARMTKEERNAEIIRRSAEFELAARRLSVMRSLLRDQ